VKQAQKHTCEHTDDEPPEQAVRQIGCRKLFNKDIVVYFSYLLVVFLVSYYKKTIWGMSLCAVGENPRAADAVGISVYKNQYMAAAVNGLLGGLGGAYLLLGQLGIFFENITAGRGYIALAVVVFGRRNPIGILLAALFFGAAEAFQFRLQILGISLPIQVFTGLPYVLTALSLLLVARSKRDRYALLPWELSYERMSR